jgi:outer membrane receptor protein involved in Fe transport
MGFSQEFSKSSFTLSAVLSKSHDSKRQFALKKPGQKVNGSVSYRINDRNSFLVDGYWVASQYDFGDKLIDAYDVFNISYLLNRKAYALKIGLNNLFDRTYEEVSGYNTFGLNGFIKLDINY